MAEKTLQPKLRFPGFENIWNKETLNKLSDRIGDGIHGTPTYDDEGEYYFINGNNLSNGQIVISENTKKVTQKEAQIYAKELNENTILISINGTIGHIALYRNENILLGKSAAYITLSKDSIVKFIYYYLQTSKIQNFFYLELTGSTIKNLSLKTIRKTKIAIPQSEEQQKIASFLTTVDKRITLLTQKKEKLEQYKKGVMQKIFNREIRFKDENGNDFPEWEEKRLEELVDVVKGQQLNGSELTSIGDYPCLNGGISPSGYTNRFNTKENTITISEGGNSCGYINFMTTKFWSGGHCYSLLNLKSLIDENFMYHYLKFMQSQIMALRVGSGLPNIQKKDICKFRVIVPCLIEQQKIASFLSAIDQQIEHVGKQIDGMKEWKKGLLQQLFV